MVGKIITIEGSDGSGKKTQTRLLIEKAINEGYDVETVSFPQYEKFWGKIIKQYLNGSFGSIEEVNPKDVSRIYAFDRLSMLPQIKKWLGEGKNIILDRYMESNWGHQGGKFSGKERTEMVSWLKKLEIKQLKLPPSDMVVYLYLPVEFNQKAMDQRAMEDNSRAKDMHERNVGYLKNVEKTYIKLAAKHKNWIVIDCVKDNERVPAEEVTSQIWEKIRPHLAKRDKAFSEKPKEDRENRLEYS